VNIGIVLSVLLGGWRGESGGDGPLERSNPVKRPDAPLPLHLVLSETEDPRVELDRVSLPSGRSKDAAPEFLLPGTLAPQQERPAQEDRPYPHDFSPPPGAGPGIPEHFSQKAWRDYVWGDYLSRPAVLLPLGLGVSAAAISHWDRRLQAHWYGALGARGYYSDAGQYALIGAVVLIGTLFPGEGRTWWDESWTIGEAFGAASLTTFVLKSAVMRPRPGGGPAYGIGTHSFPSGHSTSAFTSATLIECNSGPALGLPAYALAAFTGFERVEEGRHYPSDVLAGAAIGTVSAGIFDALHWGSGAEGGIARPQKKLALEMDGLKGFSLSLTLDF
jgi:membrane-associated phospholipid phosphatase